MKVEEGAAPPVYLANAPDVAGITEEYFVNKGIARLSEQSWDRTLQEQFWEICAKMVGLA